MLFPAFANYRARASKPFVSVLLQPLKNKLTSSVTQIDRQLRVSETVSELYLFKGQSEMDDLLNGFQQAVINQE